VGSARFLAPFVVLSVSSWRRYFWRKLMVVVVVVVILGVRGGVTRPKLAVRYQSATPLPLRAR